MLDFTYMQPCVLCNKAICIKKYQEYKNIKLVQKRNSCLKLAYADYNVNSDFHIDFNNEVAYTAMKFKSRVIYVKSNINS